MHPMTLITTPHFFDPQARHGHDFTPGDDFYELLLETHRGLSDAASAELNARLILLLANHIGDLDVLREALTRARCGIASEAQP
jgi:hypothetical protein